MQQCRLKSFISILLWNFSFYYASWRLKGGKSLPFQPVHRRFCVCLFHRYRCGNDNKFRRGFNLDKFSFSLSFSCLKSKCVWVVLSMWVCLVYLIWGSAQQYKVSHVSDCRDCQVLRTLFGQPFCTGESLCVISPTRTEMRYHTLQTLFQVRLI